MLSAVQYPNDDIIPPMQNLLHITLLGNFIVEYDGKALAAFNADRLQSLLAYLLLHRQAPQARQHLAFQLWPDSSESQARTNLRNLLHNLRQQFPDPEQFLVTTNLTLQWREDAPATIDVDQFMAHYVAAGEAEARRELAAVRSNLEAALAVYKGDLLPGNYDDWVVARREELRQRHHDCLFRMLAILEQEGDWRGAISFGQRLLLEDPLNETTYIRLMQFYAQSGDRSSIRRIYEQCAATLQRELGVEPSSTTQAAYEQLKRTAVAPVNEVGRTESRPATVTAPAPPRRKLSPPRSSAIFIGRETELAQVAQRLADPHCRLLTITGPGGIGKTGLALQTARAHTALYEDGAAFVNLAPLTSVDLLVPAMAAALELSLTGGDPIDQLVAALAEKEILLVLDNFEHLIAGADLLSEILANAPGAKMLVTSRERLNLQEEWVYDLHGLPVANADDEDWEENNAIQIFIQSARRANAAFNPTDKDREAITQICRLVDGMPLGIQLAAAWARMLSTQEIAAEIARGLAFLESSYRDIPERHRSLQAVFQHSWRLLSGQEQEVLQRLSIFRGGFDRVAAEQVAGATLALLSALVDKSLIRPAEVGRYSIHEVVRQYASQMLHEAGNFETTRRRHLQAYLMLANQLQERLYGPTQPALLDQLESEHDNLRAALDWSLPATQARRDETSVRRPAGGEPAQTATTENEHLAGARLAAILGRFWYLRGHLHEGRGWLTRALSGLNVGDSLTTDDREYLWIRAWLLFGLGELIAATDGVLQAIDYLQEGLAIFRRLDNPRNVIFALHRLGETLFEAGKFAQGEAYMEESLVLSRQLGETWLIGRSLSILASRRLGEGAYAQAEALATEALGLFRSGRDSGAVVYLLNLVGSLAAKRGELDRAMSLLEEALTLNRTMTRLRMGAAWTLRNLGGVALLCGDTRAATAYFEESLILRQEMRQLAGMAWAIEGLAEVAIQHNDRPRAVRLLGAAAGLRTTAGAEMDEPDRIRFSEILAELRTSLGQATFESLWSAGYKLSPDAAVASALEPTKDLQAH